jgi:hypothetical protein
MWYHPKMKNSAKILEKMRNNPRNWRIEQIETIAKNYGINIRKSGGSHVIFDHKNWVELLCIPSHRPIKPVYIKKLLILIDLLEPL